MMRRALLCATLAACDPVWGVNVRLRDPTNQPIEDATLAVACPDGAVHATDMAVRSRATGEAWVGSLGTVWPIGCDIYVAKPGFETLRIRYRELCPDGADHCPRNFSFELAMVRQNE